MYHRILFLVSGLFSHISCISLPPGYGTANFLGFRYGTRIRCITRSVSAQRWKGDGFDAWPKPRHSSRR